VAELKAEVDAGKSISVADLANAVKREVPAAMKGKPSLDQQLAAVGQNTEKQGQGAAPKNKEERS
jgi:hypothetical protein